MTSRDPRIVIDTETGYEQGKLTPTNNRALLKTTMKLKKSYEKWTNKENIDPEYEVDIKKTKKRKRAAISPNTKAKRQLDMNKAYLTKL